MRRLSLPYWHSAGHVLSARYGPAGLIGVALTLAQAEEERDALSREALDTAKRGEREVADGLAERSQLLIVAIREAILHRRALGWADPHAADRRVA
jgi:hypothetical protein